MNGITTSPSIKEPNPFGLTPRQALLMDLWIETDNLKTVATRMGIAESTVSNHLEAIKAKMKTTGRHKHLLKWDRFRQASCARPSEGAV